MIDRYTKCVPTVIAACLVIIVARDLPLGDKANAKSGAAHVVLDGVSRDAFRHVSDIYPLPVKTTE